MADPTQPQTSDNPNDQVNTTPLIMALTPLPTGADQGVATAHGAAEQALRTVDAAQRDYTAAASAFDTTNNAPADPNDFDGTVRKAKVGAASKRLESASTALSAARTAATSALTKLSDASTAAASREKDPNLKDYYQQHAAQAAAGANLSNVQADAINKKTPSEIAANQAATTKALADATATNLISPAQADLLGKQASEAAARTANILALTPAQVDNTQASTDKTKADTSLVGEQTRIANANANLAPQTAQATLDKAVADADKARLDVQNTQAQLNATTDDDRRRAIQLDLDSKQAALDTANANLDQAKKLMPIAVDQANATVASTQATTAKTTADVEAAKQGTLYGMQDRIQAIKSAALSATGFDAAKADQMLQDYITSQINQATTGATEFERNKAAVEAETTRRGQDSNLAGNVAGDFTTGFGSSLGSFSKLNDTTPVGSDAAGRGFLASLDLLGNKLGQFQNSVSPANSPLITSLRGPVAAPTSPAGAGPAPVAVQPVTASAAAAPAAAPAPAPIAAPAPVVQQLGPMTPQAVPGYQYPTPPAAPATTGHQITINIGGSGDSSTPTPAFLNQPPPDAAPAAANPTADSIAAAFQANGGQFASSGTPPMFSPPPLATHDDVNALWQDDSNLNPPSPAGQDDSSDQGQ